MLLIVEGIVMCFVLLILCAVGIANGPVGLVLLYGADVQHRGVELGLITIEKIRRNFLLCGIALFVPMFVLPPLMVYVINGVTEFGDGFRQISVILWIQGLFDRLFIDWYWVGKRKAWVILGTEDLMLYIPEKIMIRKWLGTIAGYPLIAAVTAGFMMLPR